jgi:hypothetical protein
MIKTITGLKSPTPADRLWSKAPVRFVVNNVKSVLRGEPQFQALVEAWWPSEKDIALISDNPNVLFSAALNEVIFETPDKKSGAGLPAGYCKTLSGYRLGDSIDRDAFWKYHTEIHGIDVVKAAGHTLADYSLNKRVKTLQGDPTFFALIEMWWESDFHRENYRNLSSTYVTASGKTPPEDFNSRGVISEFSVIVDDVAG